MAVGIAELNRPPYPSVTKPYGRALVAYALEHPEVLCVGGDLTRQTETDAFRDHPELTDRFINGGMAEQNMIGVSAGLAREGCTVFVNTFGVFTTRRPYEQVAMQIAYPALDVKLIGLMPGLSSPGGPSHQAIEDVSLMRSLPNMTVVDVADAAEVTQAVAAIAEIDGPVYLRLKRGEVPQIFGPGHVLDLDHARVIDPDPHRDGERDLVIFASGMMVASALLAAEALRGAGTSVDVVNVTTIAPLDGETVLELAGRARAVLTAENHLITGGLGSAVAEVLAEAGIGVPLRRVGIPDTFARAWSAKTLFNTYGLSAQSLTTAGWEVVGGRGEVPIVRELPESAGAYSPV